jgi:hypothetical protein
MPHKNRNLSHNEVALLDVIAKQPGLTPKELYPHVSDRMHETSISACLSRLTWLKQVNRLRVPYSSAYRYYPKGAALPEGHTEWSNVLIKVKKRTRVAKGNGGQVTDGHKIDLFNQTEDARVEQILKQQGIGKPSDKPVTSDVLILIPTGEKETLTVNIVQAKKIWQQLNGVFAEG